MVWLEAERVASALERGCWWLPRWQGWTPEPR